MRKTMNRTTVIVVLALFLAISIGYALFSDTITIEGEATAQGNMDMTITAQFGFPEALTAAVAVNHDTTESGYTDGDLTISGNTLSYDVQLAEGGSRRFVTAKVTNNGTVTAKMDLTKVVTSDWQLCIDGNNGEMNGEFEETECTTDQGLLINEDLYTKVIAMESADGDLAPIADGETAYLDYMLDTYTGLLDPGESVYFLFENYFATTGFDARVNYNNFNIKETGKFKFTFDQYVPE